MKKVKAKIRRAPDDLRLSPEKRIANKFDPASIAEFPIADAAEMGFRVKDNCAEEHIM